MPDGAPDRKRETRKCWCCEYDRPRKDPICPVCGAHLLKWRDMPYPGDGTGERHTWALHQWTETTSAKLTLIALVDHAGPDGCFPSRETIALEIEMTESTVKRGIRELKRLGLLKTEKRRMNGKQASNRHVFTGRQIWPSESASPSQGAANDPLCHLQGVTGRTLQGAASDPLTRLYEQEEESRREELHTPLSAINTTNA